MTIVRQGDSGLELNAGLEGGEQVVVSPPASLRDGDPAKPRQERKAGT